MKKVHERGQALAETALSAVLLVLIAYGLLAWIPAHRARSVANAAAYACAQFIAQAPEQPDLAAWMGRQVATNVIEGEWSESQGISYNIEVEPPVGRGAPGQCTVSYRVEGWLGFGDKAQYTVTAVSRSEVWKAKWD